MHPYKKYEENRHGRAVAQKRAQTYQHGGGVKSESPMPGGGSKKLTGGAESGVGRMQLAKRAARKY